MTTTTYSVRRYGDCALLGNGSIAIHAGRRFDLHYLVKSGLMGRKRKACFSGILHRAYPSFAQQGELMPSFVFNGDDFTWSWLDESLVLEGVFRSVLRQTVCVGHDRNVVAVRLDSEQFRVSRYTLELPYGWDVDERAGGVRCRSRKWPVELFLAVKGDVAVAAADTFASAPADFAIPESERIPVSRIVLESSGFQSLFLGVGEDSAASVALETCSQGFEGFLQDELGHWQRWMQGTVPVCSGDARTDSLYRRSFLAVKSCSFQSGAMLAGDRGYYLGFFTRDSLAPMCAMAVSGRGLEYSGIWDLLLKAERDGDGHLYAAYDVDGGVWNPSIEIDQYAMMAVTLYAQYTSSGDQSLLERAFPLLEETIALYERHAPRFLTFFIVYDEWFSDAYTSPLGCLGWMHAGLVCIARIAGVLGRETEGKQAARLARDLRAHVNEFAYSYEERTFCRGMNPHVARFDTTADAYILHASRFALWHPEMALVRPDDVRMLDTVQRLKARCLHADGTLGRHEKELHPWGIATAWLAEVCLARGDMDEGLGYLRALSHKNEGAFNDVAQCLWNLPEQWNAETGDPWRCDLLSWAHGEVLMALIAGVVGYRFDHEKLLLMPDLPKDTNRLETFVHHMGDRVKVLLEREGGSTRVTLEGYEGPCEIWLKMKAMGNWTTSQYFDAVVMDGVPIQPASIRKIGRHVYAVVRSWCAVH